MNERTFKEIAKLLAQGEMRAAKPQTPVSIAPYPPSFNLVDQRWLAKSEQADKWKPCLKAARTAASQESK